MSDDPTEDMIKAEIAAAVKILKDDGIHIHRTYSRFQESLNAKPEKDTEPGEGDPPPAKEKDAIAKPEKRGIWWG